MPAYVLTEAAVPPLPVFCPFMNAFGTFIFGLTSLHGSPSDDLTRVCFRSREYRYHQGPQGGRRRDKRTNGEYFPLIKAVCSLKMSYYEQRAALRNLKLVLEASGSSLKHIVKANVYITDFVQLGEMNEVYAEVSSLTCLP